MANWFSKWGPWEPMRNAHWGSVHLLSGSPWGRALGGVCAGWDPGALLWLWRQSGLRVTSGPGT